MSTYVLVHGAWHTGAELEPVAAPIRAAGHQVYLPTIKGNRPGDSKTTGLKEAIQSIADNLVENDLKDIVLVGHSYGGMVITGVADLAPERIRRLVYWNAFVPNNGECLNDMVPPHYIELFDAIAADRGDGSVVLPFPIWREAFINDADLETARSAPTTSSIRIRWRPSPTRSHSRPIRPRCRWQNPTSTAPKTRRCRTATPGIRACRKSWVCSAWCRCREATSYASPIRHASPGPSWRRAATDARPSKAKRLSALLRRRWPAQPLLDRQESRSVAATCLSGVTPRHTLPVVGSRRLVSFASSRENCEWFTSRDGSCFSLRLLHHRYFLRPGRRLHLRRAERRS